MMFLRRLFGLDFPDPEPGQVWRSRHSGRAVRVAQVRTSDCGKLWHIDLQHEDDRGFIAIPMSYCMFPFQWRRKLRDEGRQLMGGGLIEPSEPWPRTSGVAESRAVADEVRAMHDRLQEMRLQFEPGSEVRRAVNAASDRVGVLASKLYGAHGVRVPHNDQPGEPQ